jgi:hypothetical protein
LETEYSRGFAEKNLSVPDLSPHRGDNSTFPNPFGDIGQPVTMPAKPKPHTLARKPARGVTPLLAEVRGLILAAREGIARTVNAGLTLLYWEIGIRVRKDVLKEKRAEYGEQIVSALSAQLENEFGRGFSRRNLFNMIRFAEVFSDRKIMHALSAQLGWTHFRQIIYLDDELKRDFYAEMCRIEKWSTRTLEKKIGGMLYERTALSKKPDKLIRRELAALREEDKLTPDLVFRDPYVLDFLRLRDTNAQKDLEAAILTQAQMAELFQTTPQNVTLHLKAIFAEGELAEAATCKDYLQVRPEGRRAVSRKLRNYRLEAILAVGSRQTARHFVRP